MSYLKRDRGREKTLEVALATACGQFSEAGNDLSQPIATDTSGAGRQAVT